MSKSRQSNLPACASAPDSSALDRLMPMDLPPLRANPMVSVLIGNYNYASYIAQTIESVLTQTYQNFEICICDDGSTDRSVEIAGQFVSRDSRITLKVQDHRGQGSALNTAWKSARGDLIALLDSDDLWLPSKLSKVVERFRWSPQAGMVTHAVRYVRGDLTVIRPQPDRGLDEGWLAPAFLSGLRPRMPPCSALAVRREVAERIFPLDARYRGSADVLLRELAALITCVASIDDPLTLYRIHGRNLVGLRPGPMDLEAVRSTLSSIEAAWEDRRRFTLQHHNVDISGQPWVLKLGAELRLTERLLLAQPADELALRHLPARWLGWFWRIAFACPRPLGSRMLQMRWTSSRWKTCLKALLRFRRQALVSHEPV